MAASERPDYVIEYAKNKPERTEIKFIRGHYYLYERFTGYDPVKKRSVKVSGSILGKITPEGLVPAKKRTRRHSEEPTQRDIYLESMKNKGVDVSTIAIAESGNFGIPIPPKPGETIGTDKVVPEETDQLDQSSDESNVEQANVVYTNETPVTGLTTLSQGIERVNSFADKNDPGNATFIAAKLACIPEEGPHDFVEIGMSLFLFKITQNIYSRLESYFGNFAVVIYVLSLVRTVYGPRLRRVPANFLGSVLSHLYPGLPLKKQEISMILRSLGAQRNTISKYMRGSFNPDDKLVIADGHRIISYADAMPLAELGYDSKQRYKEQINLVYLYALNEYGQGVPRYYQQFNGSTLDMHALKEIIHNLNIPLDKFTLVADKGCVLEEELDTYDESGLQYVVPLRRGNRYVEGKVPLSHDPADWDGSFMFRGRLIYYKSFNDGIRNVFLFLDLKLYNDEIVDAENRNDKKNNDKNNTQQKELNRRKADNDKADNALKRAAAKRIKYEARVSEANEQKKIAHEKVDKKIKFAVDAVEKFNAMPIGSEDREKYEAHVRRCLDDSAKAKKRELEKENIFENEQRKLELAKSAEKQAEQDKLVAQEAVDTMIKIMDLIEHGDPLESDPDFCSKHTDFEKLFPTSITDVINSLTEAGTITLVSNRQDISAEEVFKLFKVRGNVEQFFDSYDNTLDLDATYMRDTDTMEACLFLNHLSAEMQSLAQLEVAKIGQSKNISFADLRCLLGKIHATREGNTWTVSYIKGEVKDFCEKLNFNPEELLCSFNWGNEECKYLNIGT